MNETRQSVFVLLVCVWNACTVSFISLFLFTEFWAFLDMLFISDYRRVEDKFDFSEKKCKLKIKGFLR